MLVASSDIRRASLNYCVNNLRNNEVSENVKVIVALKEKLHNMRMEEDTKEEFKVDIEEYEEVVEKFKRKRYQKLRLPCKGWRKLPSSHRQLCQKDD